MSGPQISNQDNFEDFLLSNQFYVGPSNSRNHIANLRKSVQIPNSISNTSIHAGLANDPTNTNQQRTSIMKVSPSMKALESILSERNNSAPVMASEKIVEEDEEQVQFPVHSGLPVNYTTEDPNRGSTYSVQTFETAHSDNSFSDTIDMNANESTHKSQKSTSTIDDGYNTNDDTPVLVNPAQFQTFTQVNGSNKNSIHPVRVVHESSVEDFDGQSTDVSNGSLDNKDIEQDDTLVGNEGILKSQYEQQQQKMKQKQKEFLDEQRIQEQLEQKEREIEELKKQKEEQEKRKQRKLRELERSKESQNQHQQPSSIPVSSMLLPETDKAVKKPVARQQDTDSSINTMTPNPKPLKKSPHTRSNSTFSLSFTKNKEQPPLPGKHKRSSTFSNLSAVSKGTDKPPTAKKFSFKNLFKSKPKATKTQDEDLVSKPRKLNSESYSSSNIASHSDESNTSEGWKKLSTNNKSKDSEKKTTGSHDKQSPLPQPPQQEKPPQKPSMSSSTSLLSVFKKDKASENSSKTNKLENQEQVSKKAKPNENDNEQDFTSTSNILNKDPPKNLSHNANFIREVNDDDYNPNRKYLTPIITESHYDEKKEFFNDNNVIGDSQVANSRETDINNNELVIPESDSMLNNDSLFGSPFKVDYKPSTNTPKLVSHDKLATLNEEEKPKGNLNDQLLGETLFPKSLSAQEVESIVSLERSRSMRSIKSNKRNSFVNYDGSDDNIIQYDGTRTSSPNLDTTTMSRSNSILKNSHSKKNLNSENMNSINAQMLDESMDNYDDLIEFTDYIDLDNLDFSVSPKEMVEKSPVIISSSPSLLSDKFGQHQRNQQSLVNENGQNQFNVTSDMEFDSSSIQEISPPEGYLKSSEAPPIILNTPPPSHDDDPKQQIFLSQPEEEQEKFPVEEIESNEPVKGPLTPNLEIINSSKIPESPESIDDLAESNNLIEESPILGKAYQNSPMINENGKNIMNNRPISMSFRGLKGPSFGGKLAMHDLRSSDSHQSFNMSFGDDEEDEAIEAPVSEVGGGFGSSDEEDDDSFEEFENKENEYRNPVATRHQISSKFGQENNFSPLAPPNPLPVFTHNKIPLISSNSSSPKSFSSMFSRKFKKSPTIQSSARAAVVKDGVRFSSRIILYDTYNCDEYDRHPDNATCNQLTPALAQQIKDELNEFKSEMTIHEHSRCHTHFF